MAWQDFATLATHPISLVVLMVALERFLPWSPSWHPLSIFLLLARQLTEKVLRPERDSPQRQALAGGLAYVLLLILCLLPAWWLIELSELPDAVGALILFIALQSTPQIRQLQRLNRALARRQKNVARSILSQLDPRDTQSLSPLGLQRAGADLFAVFWFQHTLLVSLLFIIGGPLLALAGRLTTELAHWWPTQHWRYRFYSQIPARVSELLSWLPLQLINLLLALLLLIRRQRPAPPTTQGWPGATAGYFKRLATLLQLPLGGPVQYQGKRCRRARFGPAKPQQLSLAAAVSFYQLATILLLLVFVLGLTLVTGVTQFT